MPVRRPDGILAVNNVGDVLVIPGFDFEGEHRVEIVDRIDVESVAARKKASVARGPARQQRRIVVDAVHVGVHVAIVGGIQPAVARVVEVEQREQRPQADVGRAVADALRQNVRNTRSSPCWDRARLPVKPPCWDLLIIASADRRNVVHQPVRIDVQPAVEVDDQEGVQRFVEGAVFGLGDGVAEVDPHAVRHAVVVVVDVPRPDRFPERDRDVAVARPAATTLDRSTGRDADCCRRNSDGPRGAAAG